MAQRTVALCDGKIIGIETIFTVVDGKQINVPEKLKELREKSQSNKLFCTCGCGANLILVAGDKNLREQHFRIKDGAHHEDCTYVTEGKTSVESKVVLKCWLDDNLNADDLMSRVPICDVSDSNRRYEFTFLSRNKGIAIDYCHNRANLSDDKQAILEENSKGIRVIHVVDYMNGGSEGQYPEGLMKVQAKQKYCLLLSVADMDYDTAEMKAAFYDKDYLGLWKEIVFSAGLLKDYRIAEDGELFYKGQKLSNLLKTASENFKEERERERQRREDAQRQFEEHQKRFELELEERRNKSFAETQFAFNTNPKSRVEWRRTYNGDYNSAEDFIKRYKSDLEKQEKQVVDPNGVKWYKCEGCGKTATETEFESCGGPGRINRGICFRCAAKAKTTGISFSAVDFNSKVCPACGCMLLEKSGRLGRFIGCSNYPKCHYTRSIR